MTIKNKDKTISAEKEYVITNIEDNINGILTITRKNQRDEESITQTIDLSKHRLNLIEKSVSDFNSMVSASNKASFYTTARLTENESGVFLVPTGKSGEGVYEEFIWGEITDSNNYQNTDYIDADDKHYNFISLQSMNINLEPIKSLINEKLDISQTSYKGKNVVVDNTTGDITFENKPDIPSASNTLPSADTTNGEIGNGTTWARSNHKHPKSDIYAEATHDHDITDLNGVTAEEITITYDDDSTDIVNILVYTSGV